MDRRLKLHEELCDLLGTRHVYYQPPASIKMVYPCYVYSKEPPDLLRADNKIYRKYDKYTIVAISLDVDNDLADRLLNHFTHCSHGSRYTADNLYHDSCTLYY